MVVVLVLFGRVRYPTRMKTLPMLLSRAMLKLLLL